MSPEKLFTLFFLVMSSLFYPGISVIIPGVNHFWYTQPGHVNIGVLVDLHDFSGEEYCCDQVDEISVVRAEAILYILEKINEDASLLPNLTLGATLCDSCMKDTTSLACAIRLTTEEHRQSPPDQAPVYLWNHTGPDNHLQLDIVGLYGAGYSRQAVMVAGYLSLFKLPLLSPFASSDDLSDMSRFPYFARLIPPDRYQTQAIIALAEHFNWTYLSLVYGEGAYGENAIRMITEITKKKGICLAVTRRLSSKAKSKEYHDTLDALVKESKARVVILMLEIFHVENFFKAVGEQDLNDTFIWVGSDSFSSLTASGPDDPIMTAASGCLYVGPPLRQVPGFIDHFAHVKPWTHPSHPWLRPIWQQKFNCSWEVNGDRDRTPCSDYSSLVNGDSITPKVYSKDVDGVRVYAAALHDLITNRCPSAFRKGIIPPNCVTGPGLFQYLKNVNITGFSENFLSFDSKGDILGSYTIYQLLYLNGIKSRVRVGQWSRLDGRISVEDDKIQWSAADTDGAAVAVFYPPPPPASRCSEPCGPREHRVSGDITCCWKCEKCRTNEVLNDSICVECPQFFWPADDSEADCERIQPRYLALLDGDLLAIALTVLSAVGVVVCLSVTVAFVLHRDHKLIKATGRELSVFILAGLILANLSVILYLSPPSQAVCVLRMVFFHFSMHLKYAPLFFKTIRIYRIFKMGRRGMTKVRFISSGSQMVLLTMTIIVQACVIAGAEVMWPSHDKLSMPVAGEKYAELHCHQHIAGFLLPLLPNLLLVLSCAALGFLSRKVPENYNESWYIFVAVATILFMWSVFLPTYFFVFYAAHRSALLALCLIINSGITIGCQFVPKIYAVIFVKAETIDVMDTSTPLNPNRSENG